MTRHLLITFTLAFPLTIAAWLLWTVADDGSDPVSGCGCKPGTNENGWHEQRSAECREVERRAWQRAVEIARTWRPTSVRAHSP